MKFCKCHNKLTYKEAFRGLKDELIELIQEPSIDELSDVIYCINRLAGTISNKAYRRVLIGDTAHVIKIRKRMHQHGCIRSQRHLINGKCPSLEK